MPINDIKNNPLRRICIVLAAPPIAVFLTIVSMIEAFYLVVLAVRDALTDAWEGYRYIAKDFVRTIAETWADSSEGSA